MSNRSVSMEPADPSTQPGSSRWLQLVCGMICMMTISSPQYVWTLFTKPLISQFGGTLSQLQITFSILIVLQTVRADRNLTHRAD